MPDRHPTDDLGQPVHQIDDDAVSASTTRSSGTPVAIASAAFARRCRHSPCTGIALVGRTAL